MGTVIALWCYCFNEINVIDDFNRAKELNTNHTAQDYIRMSKLVCNLNLI